MSRLIGGDQLFVSSEQIEVGGVRWGCEVNRFRSTRFWGHGKQIAVGTCFPAGTSSRAGDLNVQSWRFGGLELVTWNSGAGDLEPLSWRLGALELETWSSGAKDLEPLSWRLGGLELETWSSGRDRAGR